LEAYAGFEPTS